MLRRAARRLNPFWAYREEKARELHPGSLQDDQWGWVYAPTSAALYSVAWQLALVTGLLGLTVLLTRPESGSAWHELLIGCMIAAFALLFAGALAEVPLLAEAVRRRRWGMVMVNIPGMVVLLRAVDYPSAIPSPPAVRPRQIESRVECRGFVVLPSSQDSLASPHQKRPLVPR